MAVYTVHQPPLKKYEGEPDPEGFTFVRDGFGFWAFLLGPLWMLRHRMWLVLFGYIVVVAALVVAMRQVGSPTNVVGFALFMLALLIGMEAGTLRRFTLGRRGWKHVGVIVADDREAAERRFFDSWVRGETLAPLDTTVRHPPMAPMPNQAAASSAPDVIGLFPEPGARR